MVLFILINELVNDLPFLDAAPSHGGEHGFPVIIAVFPNGLFLIFRAVHVRQLDGMGFGIGLDQFLPAEKILFL